MACRGHLRGFPLKGTQTCAVHAATQGRVGNALGEGRGREEKRGMEKRGYLEGKLLGLERRR